MQLRRRQFLQLAAGATALPTLPCIAIEQAYPTRPITIIVPDAVGGIADVVARLVAEKMRKPLGQPIIIEDVSGADGNVGVGRAARARPDGYTINIGYKGTVLNAAYYSLPYDVLNDFAPITPLVTSYVGLFARKTMPAKDLNELIAWLKADPKATAGISYLGAHAVAVLFQKETETHFGLVPYRGYPAAVADLLAGHIDMLFGPLDQLPLMRAAGIKAYAVTSDRRIAMAPEIPTFAEMGLPAISFSSWGGLFAPKGTPKDVVDKLNAAAVEALADPGVQSRLADLGLEIFPREQQTPEALDALQRADAEKWWPIIKEFGIKAE